MTTSTTDSFYYALVAACSGVAAHLFIFIRGEWHLYGPHLLTIHLAIGFASVLSLWSRIGLVVYFFLAYFVGLFGSLATYRLLFHRLRDFPGPRPAAVSKLWHAWKCRDYKNHTLMASLHQTYGDFVRIGPCEIAIFRPDADYILDGPTNKNSRSDWYDINHPMISVFFSRTQEQHRSRRNAYDHAIASSAFKEYIPVIVEHVQELSQTIESYKSRPVSITDVMQWFAFDSMGTFAFGQSFRNLEGRSFTPEAAQQRRALTILGQFNSVPWLIILGLKLFPHWMCWGRLKDWHNMMQTCIFNMRRARTNTRSIGASLVKHSRGLSDETRNPNLFMGNAITLMVGASDTSASSLTALWYHLAKYPEYAEEVYQEIAPMDWRDANGLEKLPLLNAFINESMRLLPAAATFGTRTTPSEGIYVGDTFIPGDVKISISRYVVSRMEQAFERPTEFIPMRWHSRKEMIKDKRAFAPFGVGRRQCAGKLIGLAQTRMVVAKLLGAYRVRFACDADRDAVESHMKDQLTLQLPAFALIFEAREEK